MIVSTLLSLFCPHTTLNDLDLHWKTVFMRKQTLCSLSCKFYNWFGWSLLICQGLLVFWSSYGMYFAWSVFKEHYFYNLWNRPSVLASIQIFMNGFLLEWCRCQLYSLIPVWMTLFFIQGQRVSRKLQLVQSFCSKLAGSSSSFCNGWLCNGDDCKEVI